MHVTIGRVANRANAARHLNLHGLAFCGAGTGRILTGTVSRIDGTADFARVCRRCMPALRRHLQQAAAAGDTWADHALYGMQPTPTVAEQATFAATVRDHIRQCAADRLQPTLAEQAGLDPRQYRLRLLASLRTDDNPDQLLLAA